MFYIIDGYNLFFHRENDPNPFEKTRENFLIEVTELIEQANFKALIILDGNPSDASYAPIQSNLNSVEILYSPKDLDADSFILEKLALEPHPHEVTIVSSDREIIRKAKSQGANTLSVKKFFSFLEKTAKKRLKQIQTPNPTICPIENARWHEIFESLWKEEKN